GAPIGAFSVECTLDELARALKIDPLVLRQKNAAREGTKAAYGPVYRRIGYEDTLRIASAIPTTRRRSAPISGAASAVASGSMPVANRAPRSTSTRMARWCW